MVFCITDKEESSDGHRVQKKSEGLVQVGFISWFAGGLYVFPQERVLTAISRSTLFMFLLLATKFEYVFFFGNLEKSATVYLSSVVLF